MHYLDLRIHGFKDELTQFIKLCRIIHSKGYEKNDNPIQLHVNSDKFGRGILKFEILGDNNNMKIKMIDTKKQKNFIIGNENA